VFSLTLATLGTTPTSRRFLYASMAMSTLVALAGNIQLSLMGHDASFFTWLEAIIPLLTVLSTAYVLKGQLLESIKQRHANEHANQLALAEWQTATTNLDQLPRWSQFYANALQDTLRKANARRKETLASMNQDDWRLVVFREMQADAWYVEPEPTDLTLANPLTLSGVSTLHRNGNGTHPKATAAVSGTA
jgi:hypothetical protein